MNDVVPGSAKVARGTGGETADAAAEAIATHRVAAKMLSQRCAMFNNASILTHAPLFGYSVPSDNISCPIL